MAPHEAPLTPAQTHALFDILIHHQLYAEIEAFKYANTITTYGYPFRKEDGVQTTSPLLQNMVNKFALRLPGLRNVGLDFWQDKVKGMVQKLAEAELSESYDKGAIGARKALATAVSAVLEYVARGVLGGYARRGRGDGVKEDEYDTSKPDDVLKAWDDMVREAIYGDLLEDMVKRVAETGKLEDHTSLVKGAHEYIILKYVYPCSKKTANANNKVTPVSHPSCTTSSSCHPTDSTFSASSKTSTDSYLTPSSGRHSAWGTQRP
jgi:hypothetical protein